MLCFDCYLCDLAQTLHPCVDTQESLTACCPQGLLVSRHSTLERNQSGCLQSIFLPRTIVTGSFLLRNVCRSLRSLGHWVWKSFMRAACRSLLWPRTHLTERLKTCGLPTGASGGGAPAGPLWTGQAAGRNCWRLLSSLQLCGDSPQGCIGRSISAEHKLAVEGEALKESG